MASLRPRVIEKNMIYVGKRNVRNRRKEASPTVKNLYILNCLYASLSVCMISFISEL